MFKQIQMGLKAFLLFTARVWSCICYSIKKQTRALKQHQTVKYDILPLSPLSAHRLNLVKRKTLVLDLDETLIHSQHDVIARQTVKPVRFYVHKRPHIDYFLDVVSNWYDLVVFTASMEIYGQAVADKLDNKSCVGRSIKCFHSMDNRPGAYHNAIPIKSWFCDPTDTALLNLLPVLDALRFTSDVRSVLSPNLHLHKMF
ncbi:CTD nuclear envelope phosphatase 1 [Dermatophagoides pteronyssinus]|uniref:Mitochondrial import inner membrane translocase subunit TIM50 n=1 Tax=Dermatophagoides pteronyssinus TaxID=6956 RepID=A0ABQ8JDM1_DERPT|nr:CTD nuclear envelope phosphatase 1 [Dermatophagoides pteronyssinus]